MKITRKQIRNLIIESTLPEDFGFSEEDYYFYIGDMIYQEIDRYDPRTKTNRAPYRGNLLLRNIRTVYPGFVPDIDTLIEEDYLDDLDPDPTTLRQAQNRQMAERIIGYTERPAYDHHNPWYWIELVPAVRTHHGNLPMLGQFRILDVTSAAHRAGYY